MVSTVKKTGCLFILLLLIAFPAKATINDVLLQIHATLLPKTVLMDYQFARKLVNNAIAIGIVCEKKDLFYAERLSGYILAKYKNGIKDYPVEVKIFYYDELPNYLTSSTIFYLMPASSAAIRTALESIQDERLIFAFNPSDLRLGAVVSVRVQHKIKPVINIDALKKRNISLRPVIMKISKMYYQQQR